MFFRAKSEACEKVAGGFSRTPATQGQFTVLFLNNLISQSVTSTKIKNQRFPTNWVDGMRSNDSPQQQGARYMWIIQRRKRSHQYLFPVNL